MALVGSLEINLRIRLQVPEDQLTNLGQDVPPPQHPPAWWRLTHKNLTLCVERR